MILTAEVQKGMRDRDTIVFEEVADEAIGHRAGHLVFIIETLVHPDFTRRNDDLHMDMEIPLVEALVRLHNSLGRLDCIARVLPATGCLHIMLCISLGVRNTSPAGGAVQR